MSTATEKHPLASCRPLGDRVVVKTRRVEAKKGAIILPDSVKDAVKPQHGEVIAIGPGLKLSRDDRDPMIANGEWPRVPVDVRVGDHVLFQRYAGASIDDDPVARDTDEYLILREEDILALLDPEECDA